MFTIIAAVNNKGVIGRNNQMPWHVPEDLKHFRKTTLNHVLIMGRKTYESLPKSLDQRDVLIVSKTLQGDNVIADLQDFLEKNASIEKEIFIAGGEEIYRQSMQYAHRLIISRIPNDEEGDRHFPEIDQNIFTLSKVVNQETFIIEYYERKGRF